MKRFSLSLLSTITAFVAGCSSAAAGFDSEVASEEIGTIGAALTGYDDCNKILEGDLFNKVISSHSSSSSATQLMRRWFLSMSESAAYEVYGREYESALRQTTSGGESVNFAILGESANFAHDYNRKLTEAEFRDWYSQTKNLNTGSSQTDISQADARTSAYASYIRDPNTIHAWEACVTREEQPGLYAFGSRDDAGLPYVNVVWAPGTFAGVAPTIEVSFVRPAGLDIQAPPTVQVAIGTGQSFAVRYADTTKGFNVSVNGTIKDASGRVIGSFTSQAKIPKLTIDPVRMFSWAPAESGAVPAGAVQGGQEPSGALYICRAPYENGVHPGKLIPGWACDIGWGGKEISIHNYEVMIGMPGVWTPASNGAVPAKAIPGGQEPGKTLYTCRAPYENGIHPGKLIPGWACNITWGSKEISTFNYEVLTNP